MDVRLLVTLLLVFQSNLVHLKKLDMHLGIESVLKKSFADSVAKVDVISCGLEKFDLTIKNLLRHNNDTFSVLIKKCNNQLIKLNNTSFLTFDSIEAFREAFHKIVWQLHKHLVYISDAKLDDLTESFEVEPSIDNVAFLVNETKNSIDLVTSFIFTEEKCRDNQFVMINQLNKTTMKWATDNFYPKKHKNFHGCPMTVLKMLEDWGENISDYFLSQMSLIFNFTIETRRATSEAHFLKAYSNNEYDFYKAAIDIGDTSF